MSTHTTSPKTYAKRPSPAFSAKEFPDAIMRGNKESDWLYSSNQNRKGVYTWQQLELIIEECDGKLRTSTGIYEARPSLHGTCGGRLIKKSS